MSSSEVPSTAQLSDSLDAVGQRTGALLPVGPLDHRMRVHGRARTARFVPSEVDSSHPYDDAIAFIDGLDPGDVCVVATDGAIVSAIWGELFTAAAKGRGAHGLVTDGLVRDVERVLHLSWPVFAAGARPVDFRARLRLEAVDAPVVCAGIRIEPGDTVVGDRDGVVSIPQGLAGEVEGLAVARLKGEGVVLTDLLAGKTLRQVWDEYQLL